MQVLLDVIGASLLVGILLLTAISINSNLTMSTWKTSTTYNIESQGIQLARIIEYDLYKLGYAVASSKILLADSVRLKFRANLLDKANKIDTVEYVLGSAVAGSSNPKDNQLSRTVNGSPLFISYNVIRMITHAAYQTSQLPTT